MSVDRPRLGVRSTMLCVLDSSGSCSSSDRCNGYRWQLLYASMDNNAACRFEGLVDRSKKELEEVWWDDSH